MMDGDWGGMGGAGWVLMTILWVVLLAAVVWALASLFPARARRDAEAVQERPEEILDRRLARGEIDQATYEQLRATLRGGRAERV